MLKNPSARRIRFIYHDGTIGVPWSPFAEVFQNEGFEFQALDDDNSRYDFLISCRHSNVAVRECENRGINRNRRTLIVVEPECVDPWPFLNQVRTKYGYIYAKSELWAERLEGNSFRFFNGELSLLDDDFRPDLLESENRMKKFVMIQANKFSIIRGEQYSLRRDVIREAWKSDGVIDLYGRSWLMDGLSLLRDVISTIFVGVSYAARSRNFKLMQVRGLKKMRFKMDERYRGEPEDLIEVLKQYKYALVIENSLDYVSEKLFNAMAAGCQVLYVGSAISTYGPRPYSVINEKPESKKIVETMLKVLNGSRTKEFLPSEIRAEARGLFIDGGSIGVQRNLAEMILINFLTEDDYE